MKWDDVVHGQIVNLAAELAVAEELVERKQREIAGLRKVLAGYAEMFPDNAVPILEQLLQEVPAAVDDGRPKGAEAVRQILQDQPEVWFRVSEMIPMLRSKGWLPESENPANAVRTALERLVNSEESDVHKDRHGSAVVYSYRPDDARYTEEPF